MERLKQTMMCRLIGRAFVLVLASLVVACAGPKEAPPAKTYVWPSPPEQPRYYYERTIYSSGDVAEETDEDRFREFATGERRVGRGLDKPFDILAVNGRVYVSDTVSHRVAVFDFPRQTFFEIGTEGMGRLAKPFGLAADRQGHLYVTDGAAKRVHVYDLDGHYVRSIGDEKTLERPSSVAVSQDGALIYVVDTGGVKSDQHRIRVFDRDGRHVRDIGKRGGGPSEFNLPLNAEVAPDGKLYVVDTGNFRVQVFSADGAFLSSFGSPGRRPGNFSHPKGIAIDREGKVFITDTAFGNFQIFDASNRLLMFIGERSDQGGPGQYLLPAGIAVDDDGRVYVVDQFFTKIDVFRPAGLAPAGAPKPAESAQPG